MGRKVLNPIDLDEGQPKKPTARRRIRKCKKCGKVLSTYNPDSLCFADQQLKIGGRL